MKKFWIFAGLVIFLTSAAWGDSWEWDEYANDDVWENPNWVLNSGSGSFGYPVDGDDVTVKSNFYSTYPTITSSTSINNLGTVILDDGGTILIEKYLTVDILEVKSNDGILVLGSGIEPDVTDLILEGYLSVINSNLNIVNISADDNGMISGTVNMDGSQVDVQDTVGSNQVTINPFVTNYGNITVSGNKSIVLTTIGSAMNTAINGNISSAAGSITVNFVNGSAAAAVSGNISSSGGNIAININNTGNTIVSGNISSGSGTITITTNNSGGQVNLAGSISSSSGSTVLFAGGDKNLNCGANSFVVAVIMGNITLVTNSLTAGTLLISVGTLYGNGQDIIVSTLLEISATLNQGAGTIYVSNGTWSRPLSGIYNAGGTVVFEDAKVYDNNSFNSVECRGTVQFQSGSIQYITSLKANAGGVTLEGTGSSSWSLYALTAAAFSTVASTTISWCNSDNPLYRVDGYNATDGNDNSNVFFNATHVWTGAIDTQWGLGTNWLGGVPSAPSNVILIPATTNKPVLNQAVICASLTIDSGAELNMGTYSLNGALTNNGKLRLNGTLNQILPVQSVGGTVEFYGSMTAVLGGITDFNNLEVTDGFRVLSGTGTITVAGYFTASGSAYIDFAGLNLSVGGDISADPGTIARINTLTLMGSNSQTVDTPNATVGALTVAKSAGTTATLADDLIVSTDVTLAGGTLNGGSGAILYVNGNWNKSSGNFAPASGTVEFTGSTVNGDNTFFIVVCNGTVSFENGKTQTITTLIADHVTTTLTAKSPAVPQWRIAVLDSINFYTNTLTTISWCESLTNNLGRVDAVNATDGNNNINVFSISGGTYTWNGAHLTNSAWTEPGNWVGNNYPASLTTSDTLVINKTGSHDPTTPGAISVGTLTVTNGTLTLGGNLTVTGNVSLGAGAGTLAVLDLDGNNLTVGGNLTNLSNAGSGGLTGVNRLTLNGTSGGQDINPNAATVGELYVDHSGTGVTLFIQLTVSGDVTFANGTFNGGASLVTLYVGGDWIYSGGNFDGGSGIVNFNGSNQNFDPTGSVFYSLAKTGSGNLTAIGSSKNLTMRGILAITGNLVDVATLELTGTAAQNINANGATVGALTVNKSAGAATLVMTDLHVNGDVTLTSGTLNGGTGITLYVGGTWSKTGGNFAEGTGTVHFLSGSTVNNDNTFNKVICTGPGTVSFANGSIQTINDTFNASGVTLNAVTPGAPRWKLAVLTGTKFTTSITTSIQWCDSENFLGRINGTNAVYGVSDTNYRVFAGGTFFWIGASSTDWELDSNWSDSTGGPVYYFPPVTDNTTTIIIENNSYPNQPVLNANDVACRDLTIDTGASLDLNIYNLTVDGLLTNNGTLDIASSYLNIGTVGSFANGSTGTLQLAGFSGQISASPPITTVGGTVEFNISGTDFADITDFNHVAVGAGTRNVTGPITVAGDFAVSAGSVDFNGGDLSVAGNIEVTGAGSITNIANLELTDGLAQNINTNSAAVGVLIVNKSAGTATLTTSILTVNGNVNLDGGILNGGAAGIELYVGGNWRRSSGNFNGGSGTVIFNGTAAQTLNPVNSAFFNLTINNSAGVTLDAGSDLTVNGSLTISSGGTLAMDTSARFRNLLLGGNLTVVGSLTLVNFLELTGSAAQSIYSNNATIGALTVNKSAGTATLTTTNLSVLAHVTLTLGTLNGGGITLSVGGNWTAPGGTFAPGTGTVSFSNGATVSGNNIFNNIVCAGTVQFKNGDTQTINGTFDASAATLLTAIDTTTPPPAPPPAPNQHWYIAGLAASDFTTSSTTTISWCESITNNLGRITAGTPGYLADPGGVYNINVFASGGTFYWTGAHASNYNDWEEDDNWSSTDPSITITPTYFPPVTDNTTTIIIPNTPNKPVFNANNVACGSLTINSGASLDLNIYTLTVDGALLNNGTLNLRSVTYNVGATGSFTNNGTLQLAGLSGQIAASPSITTVGGTVEFNVSVTNVFAGITTFTNLIVSAGSRTGGGITVSGNCTVSGGTVNFNNSSAVTVNGNLTISAGQMQEATGNWSLSVGGNVDAIAGGLSGVSTLILQGGISQNINVNGAAVQGLTVNKTGGIAYLTGDIDVNGAVTLTLGNLNVTDVSGPSLSVSSNWNNNGGIFLATTGTVIFTGTSQNLDPTDSTFFNLTVSGSSTVIVTPGTPLEVNGDLDINGTGTLNLLSKNLLLSGDLTIASGASLSNVITLELRGGAAQTIDANGAAVDALTVDKALLSAATLVSDLTVSGDVTLTLGTLGITGSSVNLSMGGVWSKTSGDFMADTGTSVTFNNSAVVYGDNAFFNVVCNGTIRFANSSIQTINGELFTDNTTTTLTAVSAAAPRWKIDGLTETNFHTDPTTTIQWCDSENFLNRIDGTNASYGASDTNYRVFAGGTFHWTGANNNTNWEEDGNWSNTSGGSAYYFPPVTDNTTTIIIEDHTDQPVLNAHSVFCGSLTIDPNASLDANTFNLTVAGALTNDGTLNLRGNYLSIGVLYNNGTLMLNGFSGQISPPQATVGGHVYFDNSGGSTFAGIENFTNVTVANGNRIVGGTITVSADFTVTGGYIYVQNAGSFIVNGDMTISAGSINPNVGNWSLNLGGNLTLAASTSMTGVSLLELTGGTAAAQNINASGAIVGALTLNKTTGIAMAVLVGNLTVSGNVTLTAGDLLSGAGISLNVGGDWSDSGGVFTDSAGTVYFNGSTTQHLTPPNSVFYNITVSAGTTLELLDNLSAGGTVTINSTAILDLVSGNFNFSTVNLTITGGTLEAPAGTITVNGTWVNNGTFNHNSGTVVFNGAMVNNDNTFYNVTCNGTIIFASNRTQTITNLTINGAAVLRSAATGAWATQWILAGPTYVATSSSPSLPTIYDCNYSDSGNNLGLVDGTHAYDGTSFGVSYNTNVFTSGTPVTYIWLGLSSIDNTWTDTDNWDTTGFPPNTSSSSIIVINTAPGGYDDPTTPGTLSAGSVTVINGTLTLGGNLTAGTVSIATGQTLDIVNRNLVVGATSGLTNTGTISLNGLSGQVTVNSAPPSGIGGTIRYYGSGSVWVFGASYFNLIVEYNATSMSAGGSLTIGSTAEINRNITANSIDVGGTSTIGANITTTSTGHTYNGAVVLTNNVVLTSPASTSVDFGNTVTCRTTGRTLEINGDAVFANLVGAVGAGNVAPLSLEVTGESTIYGNITTALGTGQTYSGPVTLGGNIDFTADSGNVIEFGDTVTGISTGRAIRIINANAAFFGVVNGNIASLAVNGGGTANIDANITTTGTQTYSGPVVLNNVTSSLVNLSGTTVNLNSTLSCNTASRSLTITGDAVFGGTVGGSFPPQVLTVTGNSTINDNITTAGDQSYNTIALGATQRTLTSNGGSVTATGVVSGSDGIVVYALQGITMNAANTLSGTVSLNNNRPGTRTNAVGYTAAVPLTITGENLATTGGNFTVNANNNITVGTTGINAFGTIGLTATSGTVSQTGTSGPITGGTTGILSATAAGAVTLNNTGNMVNAVSGSSGGNFVFSNSSPLIVNAINAGAYNVTIVNGDTITVSGVITTANLSLETNNTSNAANNIISINASPVISTSLNITAGDIDSGTDYCGEVAIGSNISVAGVINIRAEKVTGTGSLSAPGGINYYLHEFITLNGGTITPLPAINPRHSAMDLVYFTGVTFPTDTHLQIPAVRINSGFWGGSYSFSGFRNVYLAYVNDSVNRTVTVNATGFIEFYNSYLYSGGANPHLYLTAALGIQSYHGTSGVTTVNLGSSALTFNPTVTIEQGNLSVIANGVTFNGTPESVISGTTGPFNLTVDSSPGNITVAGNVGTSGDPLGSITFTGNTIIAPANNGTISFTTNNNSITLNSPVSSAVTNRSLTLASGTGAVTLNSTVSLSGSFSKTGPGNTNVYNTITSNNANAAGSYGITIAGPVTLNNDITMQCGTTAGGGNIVLQSNIAGASWDLILTVRTGTVSLGTAGTSSNQIMNRLTINSSNAGAGAFTVNGNAGGGANIQPNNLMVVNCNTTNNGAITAGPLGTGITAIDFNGDYTAGAGSGNLVGSSTTTPYIDFRGNAGFNGVVHRNNIIRFIGPAGTFHNVSSFGGLPQFLGDVIVDAQNTVIVQSGSTIIQDDSKKLSLVSGTALVPTTLTAIAGTWKMGIAANPAGFIDGFVGLDGEIELNSYTTLSSLDFYNTDSTSHRVTINGTNATVTASGNVTLNRTFQPAGAFTLLNSTLIMTGGNKTLSVRNTSGNPQVDIGHFVAAAPNPGTVIDTNIRFIGTVTIRNGSVLTTDSSLFSDLTPGPHIYMENNWTQEIDTGNKSNSGRFDYELSIVEFGRPAFPGHTYIISGDTDWYILACHEPGASLLFSNYVAYSSSSQINAHTIHRSIDVSPYLPGGMPNPSPLAADMIRLSRATETGNNVNSLGNLIPFPHGVSGPWVPPTNINDCFWHFELASGAIWELDFVYLHYCWARNRIPIPASDIKFRIIAVPYVSLYGVSVPPPNSKYTLAIPSLSSNPPVNWFDFSGDLRQFSCYNVNWLVADHFFYSFTEDSTGNGKINRIRAQAGFPLDGDFGVSDDYFRVAVDGYEIDTSKGTRGYELVVSDPECIYIYLVEKPEPDADRTVRWRIVVNNSLKDSATGAVLIKNLPENNYYRGRAYETADTVPPRINYSFALPGYDEIFFQMSKAVVSDFTLGPSFPIGSLHDASLSRRPLPFSESGKEFVIMGITPYSHMDLAGGSEYFSLSGDVRDTAILADDRYSSPPDPTDPDTYYNYLYPSPKYPVDWAYSSYIEVQGRLGLGFDTVPSSGGLLLPPTKSWTKNAGNTMNGALFALGFGEGRHRATDLLISIPPTNLSNASDHDQFFVWPIWAKYDTTPDPGNDLGTLPGGYGYMGGHGGGDERLVETDIIWDFTGKRFLERGDIVMQARLSDGFSPAAPGLIPAFNVGEMYKSTNTNGSPELWNSEQPLWTVTNPVFIYMVPRRYDGPFLPFLPPTNPGTRLYNWEFSETDLTTNGKLEFFFHLNSTPVDLLAGRLDMVPGTTIPSDWFRRVRPFSFDIHDITRQRGGVTILNNVINSNNRERVYIDYVPTSSGRATIQVFTLDGNLVKILKRDSNFTPNTSNRVFWDGTNQGGRPVARGMYFIRVVAPGIDEIRKVMVVK